MKMIYGVVNPGDGGYPSPGLAIGLSLPNPGTVSIAPTYSNPTTAAISSAIDKYSGVFDVFPINLGIGFKGFIRTIDITDLISLK